MFEAKYGGKCANCGEDIRPGDSVRYLDGELVHVGHGVSRDTASRIGARAKRAVVCTDCFLEKPCACDDEGNSR
jgi:hypothetical protein